MYLTSKFLTITARTPKTSERGFFSTTLSSNWKDQWRGTYVSNHSQGKLKMWADNLSKYVVIRNMPRKRRSGWGKNSLSTFRKKLMDTPSSIL